MRKGSAYRRCGSCGRTVHDAKAKRCPNCAGERIKWAYKVDIGAPGTRRELRSASGFATKREALEAMARLQTDRLDGRYVEPSKITLGQYLETWWAAGIWEENTRRDYRVAIQRHIKPNIGSLRLQDVSSMDLDGLFNLLLREGKTVKGEDGNATAAPLSKKTVQNVKICLRKAFNDARGRYQSLNRENPVVGVAFKYSRVKNRAEMMTWTLEEQHTFLDFTTEDREHILYVLALTTGMRRGELLGLRRRDLDLPSGRLHVRQQWTRDGDKGRLFKGLKNGSKQWRTIELDAITLNLLKRHLETQEFERRSWGSAYEEHDLVICEPNGKPYDPDTVRNRFQRRAKHSKLPVIRFHDCRHTHATLLLEDGQSLKYVAERLGDREDTVLENYGHITAKKRADAVARIATLLWTRSSDAHSAVEGN